MSLDRIDPNALQFSGRVVMDAEVGPLHPGFVSRDFVSLHDPEGPPGRSTLVSFRLPEAIVTQAYLVIDPARRELFVNQSYSAIRSLPSIRRPLFTEGGFTFIPENPLRVPGRTVVIGGPLEGNYYHWLVNWGPRFSLLKTLLPDVYQDPDVSFLIDVRAKEEPFVSSLHALGIPSERIVWADCFAHDYQLDEAIILSFLSENLVFPELLKDLADGILRSIDRPAPRGARRRIWISRQDLPAPRRRVANMEDIAPVLAQFGFEALALETMSLRDQIAAVSEAEIVLGLFGAGHTNMIFCQGDCRIGVIQSEFNVVSGFDLFYSRLARACDLSYDSMVAEYHPQNDTIGTDFFASLYVDLHLKPAQVEAFLEKLTRGSAPPVEN